MFGSTDARTKPSSARNPGTSARSADQQVGAMDAVRPFRVSAVGLVRARSAVGRPRSQFRIHPALGRSRPVMAPERTAGSDRAGPPVRRAPATDTSSTSTCTRSALPRVESEVNSLRFGSDMNSNFACAWEHQVARLSTAPRLEAVERQFGTGSSHSDEESRPCRTGPWRRSRRPCEGRTARGGSGRRPW